jgi:charged multivesicular body protein 3
MMKAGLIEEMMNDTLESALGDEDLEEETEAEVDRVLMEITGETLAQLPAGKLKPLQQPAVAEPEAEEVEPEELAELQARLNAIRS